MRMCLNCSGFEFPAQGQKGCKCQVPHFMATGSGTPPEPSKRPNRMMQNGDVVFFTEAKDSSARKALKVRFKGHAFGVLLGHVPPFQKDPPAEHLLRLMGQIGFVSFDDVGELLGNEEGAKLVKLYEDKYYGKAAEETKQEELPLDPPSKLVDASGAPIAREGESHVQA